MKTDKTVFLPYLTWFLSSCTRVRGSIWDRETKGIPIPLSIYGVRLLCVNVKNRMTRTLTVMRRACHVMLIWMVACRKHLFPFFTRTSNASRRHTSLTWMPSFKRVFHRLRQPRSREAVELNCSTGHNRLKFSSRLIPKHEAIVDLTQPVEHRKL